MTRPIWYTPTVSGWVLTRLGRLWISRQNAFPLRKQLFKAHRTAITQTAGLGNLLRSRFRHRRAQAGSYPRSSTAQESRKKTQSMPIEMHGEFAVYPHYAPVIVLPAEEGQPQLAALLSRYLQCGALAAGFDPGVATKWIEYDFVSAWNVVQASGSHIKVFRANTQGCYHGTDIEISHRGFPFSSDVNGLGAVNKKARHPSKGRVPGQVCRYSRSLTGEE